MNISKGLTPEEKIKVLELAYEKLEKDNADDYSIVAGICFYITHAASVISGIYYHVLPDGLIIVPELLKYKPKNTWKVNPNYWWPKNARYKQRRLNAIKKTIKDIKTENNLK